MTASGTTIDMESPSRWLALLRVVVGLYFLKALWTKLTIVLVGGFLPLPAVSSRWVEAMPKIVAKQASENPILFYKAFLEGTVLPNALLFAQLTAWGETLVGLGLTFGLITGLSSLGGLLLVASYGLATQWMSSSQLGFHLVLGTCMAAFFLARAGRAWGLDAWLAWRFGERWFTRRPFA
jgi:thiosulfate dehydrogenase [quinone] large subunit